MRNANVEVILDNFGKRLFQSMNHIHERPSLLANTEILYILAPNRKCSRYVLSFKRISALENCRSSCDITVYKDRKKATKNQVKG